MENNLHDIEWIERYLDRSLNAEEKKTMEKRLAEEPDLKSKFHEYHQLIQGIRYNHLHQKLEQLKLLEYSLPRVEAVAPEGKQTFLHIYWKPMALAASLLLAVVSYVIFHDSTPDNEKLFTAYYEPFDSPGSGLTRGQNDGILTWKQRGYQAYDNGRYQEAIDAFENALKENNDPIVDLCQGNAYLALGQPEKAEEVFQLILKDHDDLVTQAKWYIALAYLKQNKMDRVRSTLWEISKSSTYGEKARKLLKELD